MTNPDAKEDVTGRKDVDPHEHEYRAAFFNHPHSRSSEEYGAWKTWGGLMGAMERNMLDGDANLVSIREVNPYDK